MDETAKERQLPENRNEYQENPAGRTVAAFVLGILSIVLCLVPFMLIGAIVGLLLEKEAERTGFHSLQKPAKVLCIVGIVLCSVVIVIYSVLIFVLGILSL